MSRSCKYMSIFDDALPQLIFGLIASKLVCRQFATTHYVITYKTIYIYYLKKLYDSLNKSYD